MSVTSDKGTMTEQVTQQTKNSPGKKNESTSTRMRSGFRQKIFWSGQFTLKFLGKLDGCYAFNVMTKDSEGIHPADDFAEGSTLYLTRSPQGVTSHYVVVLEFHHGKFSTLAQFRDSRGNRHYRTKHNGIVICGAFCSI
jgi:hypothetical protein